MLSKEQVQRLADILTAEGFPATAGEDITDIDLMVGKDDELVPVRDEEASRWVDSGGWWIDREGRIGHEEDGWDVSDCETARFLQIAHRAWHKVTAE